MFSIRYARADDVPQILNVLKHYNMHNVPSPEMPELDYHYFYVAEVDGEVVGAAGYKILSPEVGKTTLMAVDPAYGGRGIGLALQGKRMAAMKSLGCQKVITNADRPETIKWYGKHFGYRPVGTIKKEHEFGLPDVDHWTTIEANMEGLDLNKFLEPQKKRPLIINVALTGAVYNKSDNPHLPLTVSEIITDARQVVSEGASIVHIHAREVDGKPSADTKIYAEIIEGIRLYCPEVIVCVSTTGRWVSDLELRSAVLDLEGRFKPDMASLTLGSMNSSIRPSINAPDTIKELAEKMHANGIKPEVEIFDLGMLDYARYLIRKGYLKLPLYANIILGNLGTLFASERNADIMVKSLPVDTCWSVVGLGICQSKMTEWSVKNGGQVRIGLEDNLYMDNEKKQHASNVELVKRVCEIANREDRQIATPREARNIIGLV